MYNKLLLPKKSYVHSTEKQFFLTFLFTPIVIFNLMLEVLRFLFPSVNFKIGSLFHWKKVKAIVHIGRITCMGFNPLCQELNLPCHLTTVSLQPEQRTTKWAQKSYKSSSATFNFPIITIWLVLCLPFYISFRDFKEEKNPTTLSVLNLKMENIKKFPAFLFSFSVSNPRMELIGLIIILHTIAT